MAHFLTTDLGIRRQSRRLRGELGVTAAIGIVAAIIALIGSWHVSLWTDEAATISAARRSLPELLRLVQNIDAVHAAHYIGMHFWIEMFGQSPFSLRLPSALMIGLAAAGVYQLGTRLGDQRLAAVSAIIFAVLPRVTWAGIEARSYAPSAAAAAWLTVVLFDALQKKKIGLWIGYLVLVAVSIALNIYVILLVLTHGMIVLLLREVPFQTRLQWLLSTFGGFLLSLPVVYLSVTQRAQISDDYLSPLRWMRNVFVNQWFLGGTPTGGTGSGANEFLWKQSSILLAFVAWAVIVYGVYRLIRTRRRHELRFMMVWLITPIAIPTLVIGLYSLLIHPMYNPRYLTFSAPAVAILMGVGFSLIRWRWIQLIAIVGVIVLAVPVYASQRQIYAKSGTDWVSVANFVQSSATAGEGVYFSPRYPAGSGPVGLTLRRISVAYPEAFRSLRDVTLVVGPAESDTLDGYSRTLADSVPQLNGLLKVWVIRRHDYPKHWADSDDAIFSDEKFSGRIVWSGPVDVVIELSRER